MFIISYLASVFFIYILYFLYMFVYFKNYEIAKIIYEKGCVQAGEEWMERNLIIIATIAIITIFFQVYIQVFYFTIIILKLFVIQAFLSINR